MKAILAFVCILSLSSSALAWSDAGHEIAAAVATQFLSSSASSGVEKLLQGQSLVDVATWADKVRRDPNYSWTANLHFVNTPDWACNFDFDRDCGDQNCVVGAIYNFSSLLANPSTDTDIQLDSVRFLTHFLGDLHQPMHVSFSSDRGGNSIHGSFEGHNTNLHATWDNFLVQDKLSSFGGSQDQYASHLVSLLNGQWKQQAAQWIAGVSGTSFANPWAGETSALACSHGYTDQNGQHIRNNFNLDSGYSQFNMATIDLQLAKAGIRMAAVFNTIFGSSSINELPSNAAVTVA